MKPDLHRTVCASCVLVSGQEVASFRGRLISGVVCGAASESGCSCRHKPCKPSKTGHGSRIRSGDQGPLFTNLDRRTKRPVDRSCPVQDRSLPRRRCRSQGSPAWHSAHHARHASGWAWLLECCMRRASQRRPRQARPKPSDHTLPSPRPHRAFQNPCGLFLCPISTIKTLLV